MKKIFAFAFAAAALLVLAPSCSREEIDPVDPSENPAASFCIRATIDDLSTRVEFTPTYSGSKPTSMALVWDVNDKLRVYNHDDREQYSDFSIAEESIGQTTAKFNGTLVSASSYDVEVFSGSLDYTSQTQPSDGVTTGLKYIASATNVAAADIEDITFTDFSSVLAITAKMPSSAIAATIKSVELKASAPIFNEENSLTVTFTSTGDADGDAILHFFATLPKGDHAIAAGTTLLAKFYAPGTDHDVYTRFIPLSAGTFTNNELNTININATKSDLYANYTTAAIGEETNPYMVGDKYQMDKLHDFLLTDGTCTYVKMVDDVDLTGISWQPFATVNGTRIDFDGDGHTIYNLTSSASAYPSFVGYLWGIVKNVVFDGAAITGGSVKGTDAGVVAGYCGGSSHQGDFINVTVRNSTITSAGAAAYVGGLAARIGKCGSVRNCHVINTSFTGTTDCIGGLLGYTASNALISMTDSSVERATITMSGSSNENYSGVGGLIGIITKDTGVTMARCHTTGTMTRSGGTNNMGGLVGQVTGTNVQISNCYSTCTVTGYKYAGGLIGKFGTDCEAQLDHCFASGNVSSSYGYGGFGGLIGAIKGTKVSVTNCIAWNNEIKQRNSGDYSSGAIVGFTHPNCVLTSNYRKQDMTFTNLFWAPSANYDHPDVDGNNDPLVRIGTDGIEANAAQDTSGELLETTGEKTRYAYHGKHLPSGTTVTPDDEYGWIASPAISGIPNPVEDDPEAAGWSDTPTIDLASLGGTYTQTTLSDGVEYIRFHGQWEGQWREIHVIKTTLNEHNSLNIFYDYSTEGRLYLNEKCEYVGAIAGTNGPMACCQYVRVDDVDKHGATSADYYTANCALTIDDREVNIVKVASNYAAATLPNRTIGVGGPLLVWKGNIQTYEEESTEDFLATTHPRTAIGLSKDGKTVIQVAVDGRWDYTSNAKKAVGMPTPTLSKFMKGLGCYKAMNFDGGGGTQMWVTGMGDKHNIVNHPHNEWPTYGCGSELYYWIKNNEVARRTTGNAVYIKVQ